ncbi:TPA: hypothetical protein N0F65_004451 [Lagenidium giganteum]|uniref:E3 ubiquitin-protein ligase CHFR n=1 Tax=Lagenidium giganteum TaxID=4803 RepID=A0AAV2ZJK3_9STRA|nr:TPA: hypothetical protein N0F65_004451 [Lagenidium giganteum]
MLADTESSSKRVRSDGDGVSTKRARRSETLDFFLEAMRKRVQSSIDQALVADKCKIRELFINESESSWVLHVPRWYKHVYAAAPHAESYKKWVDAIWALHPEEKGTIKLFGKEVLTPRYQQVFGDISYKFSNTLFQAKPYPDVMRPAVESLQALGPVNEQQESLFNGCLTNWYANGDQYVGWHSDDETDLYPQSPVIALSLGATRRFLFAPRKIRGEVESGAKHVELLLQDGDLVIMGGTTQRTHKHALPKMKSCLGKRISLTFRGSPVIARDLDSNDRFKEGRRMCSALVSAEKGTKIMLQTNERAFAFTEAFTIGRSRTCDVVLPTTSATLSVSKIHVRIFPADNNPANSRRRTSHAPERRDDDHHDVERRSHRRASEAPRTSACDPTQRPRAWFVEDLGTTNGTTKNGQLLVQGRRTELHNEDVVVLSARTQPGVRVRVSFADDSQVLMFVYVEGAIDLSRQMRESLSASIVQERLHNGTSARRTPTVKRARDEETNEVQPTDSERKRRRREHPVGDSDLLMTCPVCMEYFQQSATLACSHTFCGNCLCNWFRSSLSCPECRKPVKAVPVRNRALDALVESLVGKTDAFKTIQQRRESEAQQFQPSSGMHFGRVWVQWTMEHSALVTSLLEKQCGDSRLATCRKIGLTDETIEQATATQHYVAMQNLRLNPLRATILTDFPERLRIFMHYG